MGPLLGVGRPKPFSRLFRRLRSKPPSPGPIPARREGVQHCFVIGDTSPPVYGEEDRGWSLCGFLPDGGDTGEHNPILRLLPHTQMREARPLYKQRLLSPCLRGGGKGVGAFWPHSYLRERMAYLTGAQTRRVKLPKWVSCPIRIRGRRCQGGFDRIAVPEGRRRPWRQSSLCWRGPACLWRWRYPPRQ